MSNFKITVSENKPGLRLPHAVEACDRDARVPDSSFALIAAADKLASSRVLAAGNIATFHHCART